MLISGSSLVETVLGSIYPFETATEALKALSANFQRNRLPVLALVSSEKKKKSLIDERTKHVAVSRANTADD